MNTKKIPIPSNSLVHNYLPSNYVDCFECNFTSAKEVTPDDVQIALWTTKPTWINCLFKIRAVLVKPFLLKTDMNDNTNNLKECLISGKNHKSISVPYKTSGETVICNIDKHLTFYISIMIQKKEGMKKSIIATTLVNFHNSLGRCYFFIIYPFHIYIVRVMLRYLVKKLWLE